MYLQIAIFITSFLGLVVSNNLNLCDIGEISNINAYEFNPSVSFNCNCSINCIRKCCAYDFYYKSDNCLRYNSTYEINVPVYVLDEFFGNVSGKGSFSFGGGSVCDKVPLDSSMNPEDAFYIQKNGTLWMPVANRLVSIEEYCIDVRGKTVAFVCSTTSEYWHGWISNIGMVISIPFLVAILVVYACLPERNTHMKSVMTYVLMFLIQWCCQAYDRFTEAIEFEGCRRLGFFSLTFNIASIYWMNVVCLDMWLSFRSVEGMLKARESDKRFYYYCVYGFGLTILHMIIVYSIDSNYKGVWYSPNMGNGICNLRWPWAQFLYYYLSVTVIILANTIFFVLTTNHIWKIKKGTKNLKNTKNCSYQNEQFRLFLKLFLVMGINWSLDIVSFYIEWLCKSIPKEVLYVVDFSNAVYGVILFFIFVIKKSIWKSLIDRHRSVKRMMNKSIMENPAKTLSTVATDFENDTNSEHLKNSQL